MTLLTRTVGRLTGLPPATSPRVNVERDLRIVLPDGVVLLADRWYPRMADGDRAPILLVRTPYGRRGLSGIFGPLMAERGYQVVLVSCRGTFGSGGEWLPFRNERADGAAVLEWLAAQPWFTPNVGTFGASYFGLTQWAVAADPPPWLKSMSLGVTSSWFRGMIYPGETFALETVLLWMFGLEIQELPRTLRVRWLMQRRRRLAAGYASLPLGEVDGAVAGRRVEFVQDWLDHDETGDPWWSPVDFGGARNTIPPASHVAGWYDLFLPHQLDDFQAMRAAGRSVRLLVGPWRHGSPGLISAFLRDTLDWADVHLRGRPEQRRTDVRLFDLGTREWLDLEGWPPPSRATSYHLQPAGALDVAVAAPSAPDRFRYDPADPTPSVGGASLSGRAGGRDNRKVEARRDVLTYTTAPLVADTTVIGEVSAELYVRSSLEHTDFFVRLCDVAPSGRSLNISDGIRRLRPGDGERQSDGSLKVTIRMFPTACTFRLGHRIRVQVSSGAHPLYARNPGSGEPLGKATTLVGAGQEVFHDPEHASAVVLPVWRSA